MSLLDHLETKQFLEEIAMERGQYCYDYVKRLEAQLAEARKARDDWKQLQKETRELCDKYSDGLTIARKALELMGCDCSPQYISGEHLSKCNFRVAKEALSKIGGGKE